MIERKAKRRMDPARDARVLILEPDGAQLDRLGATLRAAGAKVASLNRPDALMPLVLAFKPDVALVGVAGPELSATRSGRRISRRFDGAVPVIYVGDVVDPLARAYCLAGGCGVDLVPRDVPAEELVARVRALLGLRNAAADAQRARMEVQSPTLHDEVTGLYNRRFLLEMVGAEGRRRERFGGCYSVAIAELDDFLEVCERHGESECDALMSQVASVLRGCLRDADVLARVGRYHFGVLMPGMPAEGLKKVDSRIAQRFLQARFVVGERPMRASITLGTATFPDVVGPAPQMFARAIQDLDQAREDKRVQFDRAVQ